MEFTGKVLAGKGYGRTLGFPTANVEVSDPSLSGIYAGKVTLADGAEFLAAIYADDERGLLEAHLLDWTGDVYDQEIRIALGEKLREKAAFPDELSLMTAIAEDVAKVRSLADNQ
jgi:FAD synthase